MFALYPNFRCRPYLKRAWELFYPYLPSQSVWRVCHRLDHRTLHACHRPSSVWLRSRYFNCPRTGKADSPLAKDTRRAWENGQGFNAGHFQSLPQRWSFYCIRVRKLASIWLSCFLVRWLTSFLCQRWQRVKMGRHTSWPTHIKAGVPQGTLCGPVL